MSNCTSTCINCNNTQNSNSYNKITSYNDFVLYCLRKLGGEVINIELSDNQIRDRISDAIQFFREEHLESTRDFWIVYKVTAEDVTRGYINIDPDIIDVVDIRGGSGSSYGTDVDYLDDPSYYFMQNYWGGAGSITNYATGFTSIDGNVTNCAGGYYNGGGLIYYYLTMSQLETLHQLLTSEVQFSWRPRMNQLYLYKRLAEGELLTLHVYKMWNPDEEGALFDNMWLKKIATAYLGEQCATNLSKFGNIPVSGNITIDASSMLQRYREDIDKLETDFKKKFQEPPMMYIG